MKAKTNRWKDRDWDRSAATIEHESHGIKYQNSAQGQLVEIPEKYNN